MNAAYSSASAFFSHELPNASDAAWLVLADGTTFSGRAFGYRGISDGEVVFNTAMSGYPELLTDPSYRRQILSLTVSEVGNYGVAPQDFESTHIQAAGLVVRSLSPVVSNWRSERSLDAWLKAEKIPAIFGVDTRALVLHLRSRGSMMGIIASGDEAISLGLDVLRTRAQQLAGMQGCNLVDVVSCKEPYVWTEGLSHDDGTMRAPLAAPTFHVVVFDFGVKRNMLRLLVHHGCRVTVVPAHTTAEQVKAINPDGILLSNGPGDPATAGAIVAQVKELLGTLPVFGICMGHQILSQALGRSTYKTLFGHRGGNQPVLTSSGTVSITSQNHGFAVDDQISQTHDANTTILQPNALETNLSDGTNEGLFWESHNAFSVQYHPEAAPGPRDAAPHFAHFVDMMRRHRAHGS